MVADVSSDLRRERPLRCEINRNWKPVGHDSWKNERRARLWSIAAHSWLEAASPEPVHPARSSRRQPLTPRLLYRAPQRRAWLGSRCLGRRSSRLGVAVGSALLFESGFRRRGAGLLASACSVVGSDSRRLFRPARGLRAARFSVFPDDPPCTPRFFMAAQIMGCASFLSTVASPLPIPR